MDGPYLHEIDIPLDLVVLVHLARGDHEQADERDDGQCHGHENTRESPEFTHFGGAVLGRVRGESWGGSRSK